MSDREAIVPNETLTARDQEGWDAYWKNEEEKKMVLYDAIATFYRKAIIKKSLEHFIGKYFPKGSELLHAGCGAGQVDTEVVKRMKVTALDISLPALARYRALNGRFCRLAHGSILDLPFGENTFDGIYNLGVMEHFSEEEIEKILGEFRRVLKPGGKIILFWPPEYGLSVTAFKLIYFVLNTLLKKNIKLCPDEITRILSKNHAHKILSKSRFKPLVYSFGPSDFFTYSVIVAEK